MNKLEKLIEKYKARNATPARQAPHSLNGTNRAGRTATVSNAVAVQESMPRTAAPLSLTKPVNKPEPAPSDAGAQAADFSVRYVTSRDEAQDVATAAFSAAGIIGIDIETMKSERFKNQQQAGLDPHLSAIRLVQLCQSPDEVYVVDVTKTGLEPLSPLFTRQLVAHNAVFEMSHLYHAGIAVPHMDCTLLMHNALYGGRISLKDLVRELLEMDISKEEQDSDWGLPELSPAQIRYAAMDAWLVQKMAPMLLGSIKELKRERVYQLLQDAQFPVMKMEYNGCQFNGVAHHLLVETYKQDLERAAARLQEAVGTGVKISSNRQLSDHYKKVLDRKTLNGWKRTGKSDDLCLDKNTVKRYSHIPSVKPLVDYKNLAKKVQSFGDSLVGHVNRATGRIHPNYAIAGAVTGRFSCSKPNLQQIPNEKEFRQLFNAPAGRKIVVADYSQVELRILAMLANEPVMLDVYRNGGDLHRITASSMAAVPPDQVTSEQRRAAKPVNFGIIYGMAAKGLSSYAFNSYGVIMTAKQAKANIEAFFKKYPAVKRWGDISYKNAVLYSFVETKLGRKIGVSNAYTEARNYPVQGSAGEVMLAALIELDREIEASGLDIKLVNIIHDEIVLEVAEAAAAQAKALLEKAMVNGMLRIFPEAYTDGLVEANIADNWGDAK